MIATIFDLLGLILIIILSVSGLKKGLVNGVLKMVGMYAAMYASMHYSEYGEAILVSFINIPDNYKTLAGYAVTFLGVMYGINLISWLIQKMVKTMHLGAFDTFGGLAFGAAKAGLVLSAVVWAFAMVPASMRGTWQQESKLYPYVETFAGHVVKIFGMEDELTAMQSSVGSIMDGTGGLSPDMLKMLGGEEGGAESDLLKQAMEGMSGSEKQGFLQQAMQSMGADGSGKAGSTQEMLDMILNAKDATANQKAEMDKMLEEIEADANRTGKK